MSWHIREAVRQLAAGGVVAYPTETVYGLGCDPFNGHGSTALAVLKQRNMDQGLILVASHFDTTGTIAAAVERGDQKTCHARTQVPRHLGTCPACQKYRMAARQA